MECIALGIPIRAKKLNFISRADDSGTHKKETELWYKVNLNHLNFKSTSRTSK